MTQQALTGSSQMKMIYQITTILFFLASIEAKAIKKVEGTEKMNEVTLTQSLELEELEGAKLKAVGHALRNKKVAFMNFKVYVGEALMPADSNWNQKASEYIAASPAAFQMTFLRDVPADKMVTAFEESLKENEVDLKSEPAKAFLAAIKKIGDLKEKDVILVARKKADKGDQVLVLIPGRAKDLITTPAGWSDNVLKIWAGKTTDVGLEKMKTEIFK